MVCSEIEKYESKNKGGIKMQPQLTENLRNIIAGIVNVESNDTCNENANMSSMTPAGQMMKFASEVSKIYALENLVSPRFKKAHEKGLIHIHDWIFIPVKLQLACNMTWQICLKMVFILSMVTLGKHKVFPLMQRLLPLFFKQIRMNSMEDRQYQHLTSIWQKVC